MENRKHDSEKKIKNIKEKNKDMKDKERQKIMIIGTMKRNRH